MKTLFKRPALALLLVIFIVILLLGIGTNFIADLLWFKTVDYLSTFITIFLSNWGTRIAIIIIVFCTLFINLLFTLKVVKHYLLDDGTKYLDENTIPLKEFLFKNVFTRKRLILLFAAISLFISFLISNIAASQWPIIQKFLHIVDFGINDPIFNRDISFYVFRLPFYQLVYYIVLISIFTSAFLVGVVYFLFTPRSFFNLRFSTLKQPHIHLGILIAIFLLLKAWGYRLSAYNLLMSARGIAFGASYTDIHAQLPAYNILSIISIIASIIILVAIFTNKRKIILGSIGVLVVSSIVLNSIYPALIEKLRVEPNQFEKEKNILNIISNLQSTHIT